MAEILTRKGEVILVDDADYEWLNQWRWWLCSKGYARRSYKDPATGKVIYVHMHRLVAGITDPDVEVDHRNGVRTDNQRLNLRPATTGQNVRNRKMHTGKSTGYKGVYAHWRGGNFYARIMHSGKNRNLGTYPTAELAHEAYCLAADMLHDKFSNHG